MPDGEFQHGDLVVRALLIRQPDIRRFGAFLRDLLLHGPFYGPFRSVVARIAQGHNLYFQAIKVISDDVNFELEELARFATKDGQFREFAFAAYSVMRPGLWSKLVDLSRNSKLAIQALTTELQSQLDWYQQRS